MWLVKVSIETALVLTALIVLTFCVDSFVFQVETYQKALYTPVKILDLKRTTNHTADWEVYTERQP